MSNSITIEDKPKEINDTVLDLDIFTKNGFKSFTTGIRHSNALPSDTDWNFYKLNQSFCRVISTEGDRLLHLMNSILRKYEIEDSINVRKTIEDKIELIVEANDTILEKVGDNLDELNGIKKRNIEPVEFKTVTAELPISGSWNRINKATFSVSSSVNSPKQNITTAKTIHLLTGKNIIRPQTFFKDKIDNSNNYPWQPRITEKPNSIKPLAVYLEDTEFGEVFCHPYQVELDQFEPLPNQLKMATIINPTPLADTPLHMINSAEALNELVEKLRQYNIIAIDLEHHSYRTFMGITCLMQISTIEADYIIDTLELRDKLYVLNEIFTRPSIIKVFHGADSDIPWLQRDLSLYVVNMFDTHQAAKQLGYSGLSLAYLLQRFCKFVPNKQFQLADWRIRPLPQELINYAREDTHYLIYLYGVLKNELLNQANGKHNILKSVIQKCTEICKKRYFKPILNNDSHMDFYRKCKRLFDNKQMYALKELYHWRDKIARQEDESTGYVLPNHMLLQVAELLPREMQGILACCNPIPPLVRSNLLELHHIVLKAREQSKEKPIMKEDNRSAGSTQQFSKINVESAIHCPHDLTKQSEFRDDLDVLLGKARTIVEWTIKFATTANGTLEQRKSKYSAFDTPENSDKDESKCPIKAGKLTFLGPYDRYRLIKPYVQAEEERKASENIEETDKISDNSTEDRIASLHKHFLKVAKDCQPTKLPTEANKEEKVEAPAILFFDQNAHSITETDGNVKKRKFQENTQSLTHMHGTKRKKNNYINPVTLHSHYHNPDNPLHTPVPNVSTIKEQPGKKTYKRKRKPKNNCKQQQQKDGVSESVDLRERIKNQTFKKRNRNRKRQKEDNGNRTQDTANTDQSNNYNFTPFDYSSVDYGQFQGGASTSSGNNKKNYQSKFRGKNRKIGSKKNNKFSTFNNNKNKNMRIQ